MALLHTRIRDSDETCFFQRLDVFGSAVAHTGSQAADHLVDHLFERAFVRYTRGDSFRNELLDIVFHILEITVFRAVLHCFK